MRLLRQSDEYMASLYPAEANHMESVDDLQSPRAALYGCYIDGVVAACGAVKVMEDDGRYGEIKRLFVDAPFRGRGLSTALMARLEDHLLNLDVDIVRLEAGISQPEALGLYAKLGYSKRPAFGRYAANPWSVFFEKRLDSGRASG